MGQRLRRQYAEFALRAITRNSHVMRTPTADIREETAAPYGGPTYRMIALSVMAVLIGTVVSLAAIGFVEMVKLLNTWLLIAPRARIQIVDPVWLVPVATVVVPATGGLIVGTMFQFLAPQKRPLGPPDAIRATQFQTALPDLRSGLVSTLAATVSLGSGASVGQYGPMVYMGAMFGGLVRRLNVRVPDFATIAISCGVAAAISTAFNAPIAGLVFAHEVVLRHYSTRAFAPTTVAASVGYIIANVVFERPPLFLVSFDGVEHSYEFGLFALCGLLAAMVAIIFMRLTLLAAKRATSLPITPALRPAIAGLTVGITALWLPDVLGVGTEALRFATIDGAFGMAELVVLVVAKIALTALCVGFGFAGGVFSPALLLGILLGALFHTALAASGLVEMSGIAVYALCGMMALASPVIGAPLTTIIIVFELTRNYDITIATMVAVVFSNLVAHRVFGRSLFDVQLARQGIDLSAGRDQARLEAIPVSILAVRDYPHISTESIMAEAINALHDTRWRTGFAVDRQGRFAGLLELSPHKGNPHDPVTNALVSAPLIFDETTNVMQAMRGLRGFVGQAVPVIDSISGTLTGVVTEASIIECYLDTSHGLRQEENAPL